MGKGGAPDPIWIGAEVLEVVYCQGEVGPLQVALALAPYEVLALELPLDEVELVLEAFGLLIVSVVMLHLAEQSPIREGCDAVAQGEVGGCRALEEPSDPSRHRLSVIHQVESWGGIELADEGIGALVSGGGEPRNLPF